MDTYKEARFEQLVGMTLTQIDQDDTNAEVRFKTNDGRHFRLYHLQDCCESVAVESVAGNFDDVTGAPILEATEEVLKEEHPPGYDSTVHCFDDSWQWTTYHLKTDKGEVTIRWLGESNGWYDESVYFSEF